MLAAHLAADAGFGAGQHGQANRLPSRWAFCDRQSYRCRRTTAAETDKQAQDEEKPRHEVAILIRSM
jgi:hypothetical protein